MNTPRHEFRGQIELAFQTMKVLETEFQLAVAEQHIRMEAFLQSLAFDNVPLSLTSSLVDRRGVAEAGRG